MASRIAALQAKLGGGAMIMGGMRPGGARPIRKKKTRQRRASLDNSALLDRIVIKGNKQKKKVALNFDELEDTDEKNTDQFAQSVSSNINMKKTKPISGSTAENKSNDNPSPTKKKKYGMGMGGMGSLLAGGFKRKSKKGNKLNKATKDDNNHKHKLGVSRDRGQSRSFSKGVTTAPLIPIETAPDSDETKRDVPRNVAMSKTPTPMMHMGGTNMLNKYNKNSSKTPTINASGYSLAKRAGNEDDKLIEIVSKKHGKRHVRLFVDLQQYVSSKKGESGKGLVIDAFCENKYGAAMQNVGIGIGWKLSKIAKSDATKMSFFIIKNQLKNQAQMTRTKGYTVTFEGEYDKKSQQPEPAAAPTSQIKQPIKEPTEQKMAPVQIKTTLKCELVKEEMGLKVVRLFATFDKYFQGIKGENGKGLIINGFICDSFKDSGIAIGWKLSKLGKRNVTKSSFIMLRNQLMAQASTAKKFGYELTFIDTAAKRNSSSTPNSPNIANNNTNKNKNVPQTVPLNPVSAPKQKQTNTKTESKTEEKEKKKEPQLQTAEDPFGGMKQLNIGDTKKKENESGKTKMEHVRNNSLPTSPDKPKFRPKINKTDINKKRPPTQATKKIAAPSPISAKKDDEKSQENATKKKDKTPIAKKVKTPIVTAAPKEKVESKEKEKTAKKEKVKTPTPSKKKEKTPPAPQPKQTQIAAKTVIAAKEENKTEHKTKEKKKIAAKQSSAFKITPKKKHKPLPTAPKKSETETKPKKVKTPTTVQAVKEEIATEQKAKEKEQIAVAPKQGSFNITSKNKTQTKAKPKPTPSAPKINKKKSSYSAPKSCELMEEMNAGTKKIKLYQDFEKFFSAQGAKGNKGFAVKKMKRNEFGAALSDLGIGEGWKITECANKALGNRMFAMLKNQIAAAARKNRANGYDVIFENPNAQKVINTDEQKVDIDAQTSQTAKAKPKIGKKGNAETGKLKIKKKNSANAAKQKQKAKGTTPKTPKSPKPKTSTPRSSDKPKVKVSKKVAAEKAVKTPTKSKAKVTTPTPKAKMEEKKVDPIELHTTTTATIPPLAAAATISTTPKPKASAYKITVKASKLKPSEDEIEEKKFKKQRKSSYEAPKACYLIQDMTDKKKIKMYQEFRHFFSAEASDGNKGFVIKQMSKNEFGAALSDLGVGEGWKIIECANKVLGNKMFAMLKNQITAASRKNRANGYEVVFEKAKEKAQTSSDLDDKKSQNVTTKARSPRGGNTKKNKNKQRVEVIADGDGVKTLRLYHNMDKYLRSSAEKGRRGFVIAAFVKMFGDDLKECGVDIGWKLVKLGSKDVSKAFYQMTKTNLGVEFRNHKNKGYEVTFAAPQ